LSKAGTISSFLVLARVRGQVRRQLIVSLRLEKVLVVDARFCNEPNILRLEKPVLDFVL
jgi:hypothetical protein